MVSNSECVIIIKVKDVLSITKMSGVLFHMLCSPALRLIISLGR